MNTFYADESRVRVLGRSLFLNNVRYLSWSCSGIEFFFEGSELSAEIWTDWEPKEPWSEMFQGYMAVFVNDVEEPFSRFAINSGTDRYELYKSDKPEKVKIRIVKLSEAAFDKVGIVSISADGEIFPTEPKRRTMEFVGDSITCGFGIEAECSEEGFRTAKENPFIGYAALTARQFGADYSLISWSSIGVYSSSCGEDDSKPNDSLLMPMLYEYTDMGLEGTLGMGNRILWDFGRSETQVIVVNLGTNDATFTKGIPERVGEFERAYGNFLAKIREKNPSAYIICTLGMMGDELFPSIAKVVEQMRDNRIFAEKFDVQREEDGIGSEGHPNAVTHKKAAERLVKRVSEITGWECERI